MDLTFTTLRVPFHLRQHHQQRGGANLRRWAAYFWPASNDVLRVMAGQEPFGGDPRRRVWHVSVSVAESAAAHVRPSRVPTDEEFGAACALIPDVVEWEEGPADSLVRHAFEANPNQEGLGR